MFVTIFMPLLLQATLLAQEPGRSVTTGKSLPDTLLMTLPDTVVKSDSATVLMTLPDTVVKSDSGTLPKTLPDTVVTWLNEEDLSPAFVNDTLFPGTSGTITDTSLTKTGLIISSDAVD
ncbi:MAG: hypothetical protein WBK14_00420, partial [Bacteroidales bacterium]